MHECVSSKDQGKDQTISACLCSYMYPYEKVLGVIVRSLEDI